MKIIYQNVHQTKFKGKIIWGRKVILNKFEHQPTFWPIIPPKLSFRFLNPATTIFINYLSKWASGSSKSRFGMKPIPLKCAFYVHVLNICKYTHLQKLSYSFQAITLFYPNFNQTCTVLWVNSYVREIIWKLFEN